MWRFHLDKLQIPCFHVPHHNQVHLYLKELHSKRHNLYPSCTWERQVAKWSTESNQVKNFRKISKILSQVQPFIQFLAVSKGRKEILPTPIPRSNVEKIWATSCHSVCQMQLPYWTQTMIVLGLQITNIFVFNTKCCRWFFHFSQSRIKLFWLQ